MIGIKVLGAQGSRSQGSYSTCLQLSKNTLIDAGNILDALGENSIHVNNIFISHSHLDHIVDSAFLMDNFFTLRKKTLKIYALQGTIEILRKHLFNWELWPDFAHLRLTKSGKPAVEYICIEDGKEYKIEDDLTITPILANHTVPCTGFIVKKKGNSILFSGDTYKNPKLWEKVNEDKNIKAIIVDVSFPNKLKDVAEASKHLTPIALKEDLVHLKRDVPLYINHLKPMYKDKVIKELNDIGIESKNVLVDGEIIRYKDGQIAYREPNIKDKINKLNEIGTALSAEDKLDHLLDMIVHHAKELTNADGGSLYIKNNSSLVFTVAQTDSLGIYMGGKGEEIKWPPLPLYLEDGTPNKKMVAATCALEERTINIPDVYETSSFDFEGTRKFDASTGYRSKSMLVIPLRDHEHKIIGVIQLINKQNPLTEKTIAFTKEDESITLSLASQAAVSITNVKLINDLENLLESFLKSIIVAISKKSPYTAGHIKRMVELSVMLAKSINKDKTTYKNKSFSQEEIRQINFAALMHDIGKLATPEYIVDKATKLEGLFDRIEVVIKRIELIQKEVEIAFLKGEIDESTCKEMKETLDKEIDFLSITNKGDEFTSDEAVEHINNLAKVPYELNGNEHYILTENEAYNLSVQRGTLVEEERNIINEHAQISLEILQNLPFPDKYKQIPQISGNHHEKINGKGYPQGLKGDEISFEARILAVADIFEALTASDRPYKEANSLSKSMKILYFMAKDEDLDRQIVKYFFDSNLYMEYAKKFLPEHLIDEVNAEDFAKL